MNIVITGAGGFIGSNLYTYLNMRGHNVIGIVRNKKNAPDMERCIEWDMREKCEARIDADVMIHTAAKSPGEEDSFTKFYENNVLVTSNMIAFAKKNHIKQIIYTNSVSSYGEINSVLNAETPHKEPGDYGLTKYVAEKLIQDCKIPSITLILPGVVGKDCNMNWLTKTAGQLYHNQDICVYNQKGDFNNIVHIKDLCEFVELILQSPSGENKTFILCAADKMKLEELVLYMKSKIKSSSKIEFLEGNGKSSFILDNSAALQAGFHSMGLREILDELCKQTLDENRMSK